MAGVVVTVADTAGSVPREAGAWMFVTGDRVDGTIGGGHLELRAIEIARGMLADGRAVHLERFALGPSLGQCCGGALQLAFDRVDAAPAVPREGAQVRVVALDGQGGAPAVDPKRGTHLLADPNGQRWLVHVLHAPRDHLLLFGAGHVGAAIIKALADLPCTVTWIDEREAQFPQQVPANVRMEATDVPEALIEAAPLEASFLVTTHSHALDQRLTEAILKRGAFAWFGLIGSHTKRSQFERRLRARGVPQAGIDRMVCPIGLAGIAGKTPAVIAASVCAQLLLAWEARAAQLQGI